jgi:hypothetical protein
MTPSNVTLATGVPVEVEETLRQEIESVNKAEVWLIRARAVARRIEEKTRRLIDENVSEHGGQTSL